MDGAGAVPDGDQTHHVCSASLEGAVLAVAVEFLTLVSYWKSASSVHVRELYESTWYWNRVPRPSDIGWPSFWAISGIISFRGRVFTRWLGPLVRLVTTPLFGEK